MRRCSAKFLGNEISPNPEQSQGLTFNSHHTDIQLYTPMNKKYKILTLMWILYES